MTSLDPALRARIDGLVRGHRVVLFMKGTRAAPRCGFSAAAVGTLDGVFPRSHTRTRRRLRIGAQS